MEIEQFLKKLPKAYSRSDREQIEKAYLFAEAAHEGQTRANGQPYFHTVLALPPYCWKWRLMQISSRLVCSMMFNRL